MNIYPAEIEQVLMAHPAVEDVAVFGVPDHEWGEVVHAAVQLKSASTSSEMRSVASQLSLSPQGLPLESLSSQSEEVLKNELLGFLRERVARFKLPRTIQFVQQLPRTPTGKIRLKDLKPAT